MVGRAVRAAVVAGTVIGLAVAWLYFVLRPPALDIPPQGVVLSDVTVVEPGRERLEGRTVRVDGGRIAAVEPSAADTGGPYAGRFLLPGLIDLHVHHPPDTVLGDVELFGMLFLVHGVTTVRDMGSFDGAVLEARRRVRRGESIGPRIFACGPILDGAPPFWPGSVVVETADQARKIVEKLARDGVDCIKVYERLEPTALEAIRAAAHAAGLPVIGHVPLKVGFRDAALDEVQHLTGVLEPGKSELSEARLRSIITTSAVLDIAHTPTLVTWARTAALADYRRLRASPEARSLPRYFREVLWNPKHDLRFRDRTAEEWAAMADAPDNARRVARRLHENGIRLLLGTDTMVPFVFPGSSLHEEMREFEGLGYTPEEVWSTATWRAGETLGEPYLGRIVVGAPADLLIFREDPTRDLAALETLEAVVADGRLYPISVLQEDLALRRVHFEGPLVDWLTMQAATWASPGGFGPIVTR